MSVSRLPVADNQAVKYECLDTFSRPEVRITRVTLTGEKVYLFLTCFTRLSTTL